MTMTLVALGCLGGAIPDLIRLAKQHYKTELPDYLKRANFYIGVIILVALGGLAAWLGNASDAKTALAYGFAAPEAISRLLATGEITQDRVPIAAKIRRFWAF